MQKLSSHCSYPLLTTVVKDKNETANCGLVGELSLLDPATGMYLSTGVARVFAGCFI
jgi:hypothetical protein